MCGARRNSVYEVDFRTVECEESLCDRAQREYNLVALARRDMVSTPKKIVGEKGRKTIIYATSGECKQTPLEARIGERDEIRSAVEKNAEPEHELKQNDQGELVFETADLDEVTGPHPRRVFALCTASYTDNISPTIAEWKKLTGWSRSTYIADEEIDSLGCNKKLFLTMLTPGRTPFI